MRTKITKRYDRIFSMVAVCCLISGGGCARNAKPVSYAVVAQRKITAQIIAHGTVEASASIAVRPKTNGEVITIQAHRGDAIKKGALIATLDDGVQQRDLSEAKLEYEIAKLQLTAGSARPETAATNSESVEILKRRLDLAGLKVERMEDHVRDCEIRAPLDGELLNVNMDTHQFVFGPSPFGGGSTVAEIIDDSDYVVSLMFDEVTIARIAKAQVCSIRFDAVPSLRATGRVDYIGTVSREPGKQGQFPVNIRFNTASQLIKPGMSAKVDIMIGSEDGLAVAISSIHYNNDLPSVLLVDANGTAHNQEVTLGIDDTEFVEVSSGLKEGDRIVAGH